MKHTQVVGKVDGYGNGRENCEVSIEWELTEEGRFSMSGYVWNPRKSGILSGGQNLEEIAAYFPRNSSLQRKIAIWRKYHLNDMRPGCEHQRAGDFLKDQNRAALIYRFTLDAETLKAQNAVEQASEKALAAGDTVTLSPGELQLVRLPYELKTIVLEGEATPEPPSHYKMATAYSTPNPDRKTLGWLSPEEHPLGLLGKPCPACGYKYGTAWLKEEIPAEIQAEIRAW